MGLDDYECQFCGKTFDYVRMLAVHKSTCGLKKLNEFDECEGVKSLDGFEKRLDALRKNDYDENGESMRDKSRQVNLRNRTVKE